MVDELRRERHVTVYSCCVEPYPDVTIYIHMRRGSLFYVVNLIAPCFLIFIISFLGFFLPVESGDKVNLETTILLALVVFLLLIIETMPPTPDVIPVLGRYSKQLVAWCKGQSSRHRAVTAFGFGGGRYRGAAGADTMGKWGVGKDLPIGGGV